MGAKHLDGFFICRVCLKKIDIKEKVKGQGKICKTCYRDYRKDYRKNYLISWKKNNKDKVLSWDREYKKNNRDKCIAYSKRWIENNREKHRAYVKNSTDRLADSYLAKLGITEEFFELKRAQIKLLRAVKQSSVANQPRGE